MFAIEIDVTGSTGCDDEFDDQAPYEDYTKRTRQRTAIQQQNDSDSDDSRGTRPDIRKTKKRETLPNEQPTEPKLRLMASLSFIYEDEDVRLSLPRRPCYLVFSLNKLNAAGSCMRALRVTSAEGVNDCDQGTIQTP